MRRTLVIAAVVFLALATPASAAALPYLTVGNARHTLEERFESNEEQYGDATYTLNNCYRVSGTHVNCYAEVHASASGCEVELWRVWEVTSRRGLGWFGMHTQGQYWEACQEEGT